MPTINKENYLKALYHLHTKNEEISLTELSKVLQISKPSANNMIKKLQKKGWVDYQKYQPIFLTEAGSKQARLIVRKHRLAEMFLTQKMGFGWEEVHDIAEEIEHIHSDKFFDRMDELLGFPKFDPHGSPIPSKDGVIQQTEYKQLSEVSKGQTVRLSAIRNSDKEFLIFLTKRNLQLGKLIKILNIEQFDNSIEVQVDKDTFYLSNQICQALLVESV